MHEADTAKAAKLLAVCAVPVLGLSALIFETYLGVAICSVVTLSAGASTMLLVGERGSGKQAKKPKSLSNPAPSPRSERKLAKSMAEAGKMRMCRFCDVAVTVDMSETHVGGKKHKRLAGNTDHSECWRWVDAPQMEVVNFSQSTAEVPARDGTDDAALVTPATGGGRWQKCSSKKPSAGKTGGARQRLEKDSRALPTLGFKVIDGVEPILPLIRSGHKTIELRRRGSRLSDGSIMDRLQVGDRFVGIPLADRLTYRCVMELAAPVEGYASHGAAWEAHREKAVPRSLGVIRTAAEAQRFYEKAFYDGNVLVNEAVLAIPVRVVAWFD